MTNKKQNEELEKEDFWDYLCSSLEILKSQEKQDIVREFCKRFYIPKAEYERKLEEAKLEGKLEIIKVQEELIEREDSGKFPTSKAQLIWVLGLYEIAISNSLEELKSQLLNKEDE